MKITPNLKKLFSGNNCFSLRHDFGSERRDSTQPSNLHRKLRINTCKDQFSFLLGKGARPNREEVEKPLGEKGPKSNPLSSFLFFKEHMHGFHLLRHKVYQVHVHRMRYFSERLTISDRLTHNSLP